jgi:hypothetical protein
MTYEELKDYAGYKFRLLSLADSELLDERSKRAIGKTGTITYIGTYMGRYEGFPINVEWDGKDTYGINSLIGGKDKIEVFDDDGNRIMFPSEKHNIYESENNRMLHISEGAGTLIANNMIRNIRKRYNNV